MSVTERLEKEAVDEEYEGASDTAGVHPVRELRFFRMRQRL